MRSSLFHPFLRLDARTGSLRLPATICSSNFRDRTLVARDSVECQMPQARSRTSLKSSAEQRVMAAGAQHTYISPDMGLPMPEMPVNGVRGRATGPTAL